MIISFDMKYLATTEHGRAQLYANSETGALFATMLERSIDTFESQICQKAFDLVTDITCEVFDDDHYNAALDELVDAGVSKETIDKFREFGDRAESHSEELKTQLDFISDVLNETL